jgi:hypothetical protein
MERRSQLHSLALWFALLVTFFLSALSYASDIAMSHVILPTFDYASLGSYFRVADMLGATYASLEPLLNFITGIGLLSFMVLVVSVATLNSRRGSVHNLMTIAAFVIAAFGLVMSYYYGNQLVSAIAIARNQITTSDWQVYLGVVQKSEQAYGFWGAPYDSVIAVSGWIILFALGVAVFTIRRGSGNEVACRVCNNKMTLIDKEQLRWYCPTDDRLYLAKQDQVIENALRGVSPQESKPGGEQDELKTASVSTSKFCRYCGAKIPRQSKFCEECGNRLA